MRIFLLTLLVAFEFSAGAVRPRFGSFTMRRAFPRAPYTCSEILGRFAAEDGIVPLIVRKDLVLTNDRRAFWKGEPVQYLKFRHAQHDHYQFSNGVMWQLLRYLAETPEGQVRTFEEIVTTIWGRSREVVDYKQNLVTNIFKLRGIFKKVDPNFHAIESVNGVGFRWVDEP